MMDNLAREIAKLTAVEEIRRLKGRYARVCDQGYNPEEMVTLFTADAIWDGGERFGVHRGTRAIYEFFDRVRHDITWALHYIVSPMIEVADDLTTATGSWYLWQPCTMRKGNGLEAVWLAGTYFDRYRKEDGAWKFAEVHITFETITPYDEGWVRCPFRGD